MNKLIKSAIFLMALAQLSVATIIVAPPPLAYSPLKEIGSKTSLQLNYLSVEGKSSDTTGYGIGVSHRIKKTEDTFHNFSFYYMYLGSETDSQYIAPEIDTYVYNVSYQYGANLTPEVLGFVGGNLNYTSVESGVPIGSSTGSDKYTDTVMYSLNSGLQYEHKVNFGVLIPWVAFTYVIGGNSDIETIKYGTDLEGNPFPSKTSSIDIESFGAYQLGFDIYFDAIATSLSSMYQSSDDGDLLSLSLSYNF